MGLRLDLHASGPMYHRMRQDILARIRRGEFGPGDQLPSESQLCEQYGVSITTARRALLELVKEGVVQRRAGVGTMVSPRVRQVRLAFVNVGYLGESLRRVSDAMGQLIAGIGERAWQQDASFSMTGIDADGAATYLRDLVRDRSADGVLLRTADNVTAEMLEILEGAGLPYVAIKRHIPGRPMNCVVSDDVAGGRLATAHLIARGHRRIGFVCAKPHLTMSEERFTGYRQALAEHDLPIAGELVARDAPDFLPEWGDRAVEGLLQLPSPPSAVFIASDTMALGGYEAARRAGLRVPEDLAIVGYDDIAPVALLQPPLTTVRTSHYEFGQVSAQLLIDLIEGRQDPPQQRRLAPTLVVRESSGRVSRAGEAPARPRPAVNGPAGAFCARDRRLRGRVVVHAGAAAAIGQRVLDAFRAAGATVEPGTAAPAGNGASAAGRPALEPVDPIEPGVGMAVETTLAGPFARYGQTDIVLYTIACGPGTEQALSRALAWGRSAVNWLRRQGGGRRVLLLLGEVAATPPGSGPLDRQVAAAAARAGLEQVVGALAALVESREVRVNGLLATGASPDGARGPAVFLATDEAAALHGTTLVTGDERW